MLPTLIISIKRKYVNKKYFLDPIFFLNPCKSANFCCNFSFNKNISAIQNFQLKFVGHIFRYKIVYKKITEFYFPTLNENKEERLNS